MSEVVIREIKENDYHSVKEIFQQGIETGNATFETQAPEWDYWNKSKLPYCRLCAVIDGEVIGWAALSATSSRYVYRGINEVSIYISKYHAGKGIGKILMQTLVEESEKNGVWTLYASIFPENKASIHLHKSFGFREIGYMEKAGCMDGIWRDTVLLERRSKIIGV